MKELQFIDAAADDLGRARETFAAALEGAVSNYYKGNNFTSSILLNAFYEQVDRLLLDYLGRLSMIGKKFDDLAVIAHQSASEMPYIKELSFNDFAQKTTLKTLGEAYVYRVRESLERDAMNAVSEVSIHVKKTNIRIGMIQATSGYDERSAMIKVSEKLRQTMDRRGRQIKADQFVSLTVRDALLTYYNEVVVIGMHLAGQSIAVVKNENEKHRHHGRNILVSGAGTIPTYEEIRGEVFHPRSRAILAVKV